jgi:hypothetical protein
MSVPAVKENVFKDLEKYKAEGAILLMPSTHIAGLSEFHAPVIELVQLSSDPNDGDVYPHDNAKAGAGKKWRPTKQALMKLSVCAGVIWSPTESRRLDNGSNRDYIAYRAVGGIKKADGQPVFFSADYDIDFEVMEDELREQYEKKASYLKKGEGPAERPATAQEKSEYIEYCVRRDMLQKRKFKLRLCEAGAMNRVLRMLLGIKQAYTTEELKKPFVMMRIVFRPDFTDPQIKQQFIDASIKAMTGVYGPGAAAALPEKAEILDITKVPEEETETETESAETDQGGQEAPSLESQITDFQNSSAEDQTKTIRDRAKKVGYNLEGWLKKADKKTPLEMSADMRLGMFDYLLKQPVKDESSVPFDMGGK